MRFASVLVVLLACYGGGSPKPAVAPQNTQNTQSPSTRAGITTSGAVALISDLATVLEHDDAIGLADVADPDGGIRIWQRPGAQMNIMGRMTAGGGAPSTQLAHTDLNEFFKESYRAALAGGIRHALAITDVDPARTDAPAYRVDCGGDMAPPARASLDTHPQLRPEGPPYFLEDGAQLDRDLADVAFVLRWSSEVEVWLVRRSDRLYVSDVFVDSPCDA